MHIMFEWISTYQNISAEVKSVHASEKAFAAILTDGSVVAWGDEDRGGEAWLEVGEFSVGTTTHLTHLRMQFKVGKSKSNRDSQRGHSRYDSVGFPLDDTHLGQTMLHLQSHHHQPSLSDLSVSYFLSSATAPSALLPFRVDSSWTRLYLTLYSTVVVKSFGLLHINLG